MQGGSSKTLLLMVAVAVASVATAAAAAVEHDAAGGTTDPAVPDPQVKCTCYPCGEGCPQIPPPPPPSEYWPPPYGPPPPPEYWPTPNCQPPPSPYLYVTGTQGNLYPFDSTYFPSGAAPRPSMAAGPVPVSVVAGMFAVLKFWWL